MRRLFLTFAAAVTVLSSGAFVDRADALVLGKQAGLGTAVEDLGLTEQIHCVPGYSHHRWLHGRRHWDGCTAPIVVVPSWGHHHHHRRHHHHHHHHRRHHHHHHHHHRR